MLDFLYSQKRRATDIVAEEFVSRWSELRPSSEKLHIGGIPFRELRRRLNVELAHLSYDRLAMRERDDQLWRYAALIATDVLSVADCFLAALREPERGWFGKIPNGDRPWLVVSMLPADASNIDAEN